MPPRTATKAKRRPPSYQVTSSGRSTRVRVVSGGTSPAPAPAAAPAAQQPAPSQRPQVQQPTSSTITATKIERSNYQSIILMEYVAAVLLTALTPVSKQKAAANTGSAAQGLSPYAGSDIVKLGAITLLYLVLAMLSVAGRGPGRFAAWFGGLILIVDGMYEASNLVKDINVLLGGARGPGGPGPGTAGTAPNEPPIQISPVTGASGHITGPPQQTGA